MTGAYSTCILQHGNQTPSTLEVETNPRDGTPVDLHTPGYVGNSNRQHPQIHLVPPPEDAQEEEEEVERFARLAETLEGEGEILQ